LGQASSLGDDRCEHGFKKDLPILPTELPNDLSIVAVIVENRRIVATVDRESFINPFGLNESEKKWAEHKFGEAEGDVVDIMRNIRLAAYSGGIIGLALMVSAIRKTSQLFPHQSQ
jgi:hypothetical protein